ncbi:DUF3050 domain-containing protein [Granulicella sp. S190]|uniref:DUF3050 domain-containing protein n=1 Tax=Granulicella sp. S190 TaxID=1747226 RepID=UPI00131C9216|nr:DUF3050 domain-containing protein [Granulicella sp. S190]
MSLSKQTKRLQMLAERLRPLYDMLASHPLYAAFETIEDLHVFMESHVFAVWDFMSLLKSLQRGLTCVEVPWVPSRFAESRRLINEIVLGEESDVYGTEAVSHFELYLRAMRECGASTTAMTALLQGLRDGRTWEHALAMSGAPAAAQRFVRATFAVIQEGKLHAIAAAFTFGREDLIPDMFRGFIRDQNERLHGKLELMRWYMERHIEVDGEEHGPMSLRMVADLCGEDAKRWDEAGEAAEVALRARLALWDGIAASLQAKPTVTLMS